MSTASDGSLIFNTELDTDGYDKGADAILQRLDRLCQTVENIGTQMTAALEKCLPTFQAVGYAAQEAADQTAAGMNRQEAQLNSFSESANASREAVTGLNKDLAGLSNQNSTLSGIRVPTQEYKDLTNDLAKAEAHLDSLIERQARMEATGVKESSKAWQGLMWDIENAERKVGDYKRAIAYMEQNGQAFTVNPKSADSPDKDVPEPTEADATAWDRLGNAIGSVARHGLSATVALAKIPFQTASRGASLLASGMKNVISKIKESTIGSHGLLRQLTSLKTLLKTRLKRMFISQIMQTVGTAINSLTQFSSSFDAAMSNIKNSTTELGANLSVSLGRLIEAVEPVITRIVSALSTAVKYLNAFFAMLSGKSSVTVAKKQTASYASSLDKATGSAEKLKRSVAGFDELERLGDNSSSNGGSGAGTGQDMFEEVPVESLLPDSLQSVFDEIKNAIENGDWYGVGAAIADGMNVAIKALDDWINNDFRPAGVLWAGRIAEILNGVTAELDWALLGKTIGDGLNATLDIVNTFLTTYDFTTLGQKLSEGMQGIVDNVEWDLLGETLANGYNVVFDTLDGFFKSADPWESLGQGIAEGVNSFAENLHLEALANAAKNGINHIALALDTGITGIDWYGIGGKVSTNLTDAITGIDWGLLGQTLSDAVKGLFEYGLGYYAEVDWAKFGEDLGKGLADLIANIDWPGLIVLIGGFMVDTVSAGVNTLLGVIDGLAESIAEGFFGMGEDGIGGFFEGISQAMKTAAQWIDDNVITPIVTSVKNFLGIHSPSTVFAEIGRFTISGLLQGISSTWSTISGFFVNNLASLKTTISNKWTEIKNATVTKWSEIKTAVTSRWEGLKSTLKSTDWKSVGGGLVDGLYRGISEGWGWLKDTVGRLAEGLTSRLRSAFDVHSPSRVWAAIGTYLDEGLKAGIQNGQRSLMSSAGQMAEGLTDRVTSGITGAVDSVASTLAAIDAMLADSGMRIPDIATGHVIPYRAALAGGERPTGSDITPMLDAMSNQISAMMAGFEAIIAAIDNKDLSVHVGDDTIGQAADRYRARMDFIAGSAY